jgi:hypothetical protein
MNTTKIINDKSAKQGDLQSLHVYNPGYSMINERITRDELSSGEEGDITFESTITQDDSFNNSLTNTEDSSFECSLLNIINNDDKEHVMKALITRIENLKTRYVPAPYEEDTDVKSKSKISSREKNRRRSKKTEKNNRVLRNETVPQSGWFAPTSTLDSIKKTADVMTDKVNKLDVENINKFIGNMNANGLLDKEFLDTFYKGMTNLNGVADYVNKFNTPSMKDFMLGSLDSVALVTAVYSIYRMTGKDVIKNGVIALASVTYFAARYGMGMLEVGRRISVYMNDFLEMEPVDGEAQTQSAYDARDVGKLTSLLLGAYASCVSGKNVPIELFKNLGNVTRVTDSIESVIKYVIETLEMVYNWVLMNYFDKKSYQRFMVHKDADFKRIIERTDYIDQLVRSDTFIPNSTNIDYVTVTLFMINSLLRDTPRVPDTQNLCNELSSLRSKYVKFLDENCSAGQLSGNQRIEPVTMMVKGAPGVTKTLLTTLIANDMSYTEADGLEKPHVRANPSNYTYYRRPGEKYWDTYTPHHTSVVIDDFGQVTDVAGGETSEYIDLIHMVNAAPYPLRMAEVSLKGKRFFNSKYLFMTTNLSNIRPVSVHSANAVKRRIHLLVEIIPDPEYRNTTGGFDEDKLPKVDFKGTEATDVNLSMVSFNVVDWDNNVLEQGIRYPELRSRLLEMRAKKQAHYDVLRKNFDEIMQEVEPQVGVRHYPSSKLERVPSVYHEMRFHDDDMEAAKAYLNRITRDNNRSVISGVEGMARLAGLNSSEDFITKVAYLMSRYGDLFDQTLDNDGTWDVDVYSYLYHGIVNGDIEPLPLRSQDCFITDAFQSAFDVLAGFTIGLAMKSLGIIISVRDFLAERNYSRPMIMLATTAIPLLSVALYKLLRGIWKSIFGTEDLDKAILSESEVKNIPKAKIERNAAKIKSRVPLAVPQLGNDTNGVDLVDSIMSKNAYDIYLLPEGEEPQKLGYCLAVVSTIVMMPWHFITHMNAMLEDDVITLDTLVRMRRTTKDKPIVYTFRVKDFIAGFESSVLESNDIVLVKMPRTFQMHKDIVKNFITDENLGRMRNIIDVSVVDAGFDKRVVAHTTARFVDNMKVNDVDGTHYILRQSFMYSGVDTSKGDCGSVIAYMNPAIQKEKLIGMHVAGATSMRLGYCGAVTQSMLNDALSSFTYDKLEAEMADVQSDIYFSSGQFNFIRTEEKSPRIPTTTKLTKSALYGTWNDLHEPEESPAPLDRMFKNGLTKKMYEKYSVREPISIWYDAQLDELHSWFKNSSPISVQKRIFTYDEAVKGIPGTRFKGLDRSTSSGYPYNLDPRTARKTYFFGNKAEICTKNPVAFMLQKEVVKYVDSCREGVRIPQIYSDFPKDELLPTVKVEQGKVRLISGCTMVLLIAMRQYFGAFTHWLMENNVVNGSTIGTNPMSADWHILAIKLLSKNTKISAGDFRGYDGSLTPELLWAILDFINEWYNDAYSEIRRVIWYEIVFSWHIFEGYIFEWIGSMPSGNPMTAVINTLANHIVFRKAWHILGLAFKGDFNDHVFLAVNGDDNIFSVSDEFSDLFNEYTVIPAFAAQGLTYTTETKTTSTMYEARGIEHVEYLKRSFVWNDEIKRWMAPLRLSKVLEMPYWTRNNDQQIVKDKTGEVLVELALAGRSTYDKYAPVILQRFEEVYGTTYGWFPTTAWSKLLYRAI